MEYKKGKNENASDQIKKDDEAAKKEWALRESIRKKKGIESIWQHTPKNKKGKVRKNISKVLDKLSSGSLELRDK